MFSRYFTLITLLAAFAGAADEQELDVTLGGIRYTVKAGRQQVLNLLISTFENAVEKNHELIRINEELLVAKEQLTQWNEKLESLNKQLEGANTRMSRDLEAAAKVQQSLLPASKPDTPGCTFPGSTCRATSWPATS